MAVGVFGEFPFGTDTPQMQTLRLIAFPFDKIAEKMEIGVFGRPGRRAADDEVGQWTSAWIFFGQPSPSRYPV